jgi:hypothetical protein
MNGHEGAEWPWCAGFVSFVLKQASATGGLAMPVSATFSCDLLATDARRRGRFLAERDVTGPGDVPPGSIFLNRRVGGDWVHTGIRTTPATAKATRCAGGSGGTGTRISSWWRDSSP